MSLATRLEAEINKLEEENSKLYRENRKLKEKLATPITATAPEMLVALEDLLDLAEPMCVEQEDFTLVQARKAIAKAKGEKR